MKTHITSSVVASVAPQSAAVPARGFTLGLALGDRRHYLYVLSATGALVREGSIPNTRPALQQVRLVS